MSGRGPRKLTAEERRAIGELERLAKCWPRSLKLFSWSGTLCIMDAEMDPGNEAVFGTIRGIPNDGGDP